MSEPTPLPPKPVPDPDTQPYWDAVKERRLVVQHCGGCGHWIWQPRPVCPRCHAADPEWTEVSGAGTVASWTVVHPPVLAVWQGVVPFTILLVELDVAPGVRMVGQLVDEDGERLQTAVGVEFGARLALVWRTDEAGQVLPAWRLAP
ncbi:MAG: OB-fold domain-containing protein [Actinomycetota bacterium]